MLTTEFKINLVAPAVGDRILARGKVVKAGRTLTLAQTEVFAESGGQQKLIAPHRDIDGDRRAGRRQRLAGGRFPPAPTI